MRFIHFGCWNYDKCVLDTKNNNVSVTMTALREYIKENKVDFITIAGDNYYPESIKEKKDKDKKKEETDKPEKKEKKKKEKIFHSENFMSGVSCLPAHFEKYILLGNHEYDIVKVNGETENREKCFLLNEEKRAFTGNSHFFNNVMTKNLTNTLIVMIDSTLYEKDIDINVTCFEEAFVSAPQKDSVAELIEYQNSQVIDVISKTDKQNIIIIAHHPIVTVKAKDSGETKKEVLVGLKDLYEKIYKRLLDLGKLSTKKFYHLCADTHSYQYGNISISISDSATLNIEQYVCGTGGAEKDNCPDLSKEEHRVNNFNLLDDSDKVNISYTINVCEKINGFLDVTEDSGKLNFNFIRVPLVDIADEEKKKDKLSDAAGVVSGGYKQKYLKYKIKYINLKKVNNIY